MKELTEMQQRVKDFIARFQQANGYPPTIVEICEEFDWASTMAAATHLRALAKKGHLYRPKRTARAITLIYGEDEARP